MQCSGVCLLLTEAAAAFQTENGPPAGPGQTWPAWPNARAHGAELDMVRRLPAVRKAITNAVATLTRCLWGVLHLPVCSIELVCPSSLLTGPASPQLPAQGSLGQAAAVQADAQELPRHAGAGGRCVGAPRVSGVGAMTGPIWCLGSQRPSITCSMPGHRPTMFHQPSPRPWHACWPPQPVSVGLPGC
jgi:hypothetical protein